MSVDSDAGQVDRWVSLEEAARLLGKSEKTLRRYLKAGRLDTSAVQTEETVTGFRYRLDRDAVQALAVAEARSLSSYPASLAALGVKVDTGLDMVATRFEAAVQPLREQVEALGRALPPAQEERDLVKQVAETLETLVGTVQAQAALMETQAEQIGELRRELQKARRPWWRRLTGKREGTDG